MLAGVTISNGMDWSDDDRTMYFIDSFAHGDDSLAYGVDVFDFDAPTGSMSNRRRLAEVRNDPSAPAGFTAPDGMTLDSQGHLWVAVHGAGEVRRYDPEGTLVGVVELPVVGVTSVAFGGDDLGDLYITTNTAFAAGDARAHANEGGIFRCRPGVRGRPANTFAG
jgi:sugar lactone lactonase YvrE